MTEQKLYDLLQDMTLEEKVNQLLQLPARMYEGEGAVTGNLAEEKYSQEEIWQAGSILGLHGASALRKIQDKYMEGQPHHIPLLFMLDVIHGLRTVFPMPLAQGASFNPEMTERCAAAAAKESAVSGVHVTFAPMADLVRDARWGRVMESTGEDPYLNGLMAAAMVRGFQGSDVGEKDRVAACVKHFAGYGAPDGGREYNNVELSEHALREFYLPAYEAGIKAGSELVMTSFNTLDGIPSSGNRRLMRDILRGEMGFEGVLISDFGAVEEMIAHGFCEDGSEAAKKAILAGVDIDMVSDSYCGHLAELVRSGEVEEKLVDEAVLRVLRLKNKLGLFENPYKDGDAAREREVILCEENRKLAREAARETFVLLKNEAGTDGVPLLPLKRDKMLAFIGPYVDCKNLHSAWAICGQAEDAVSVREAVTEWRCDEGIMFATGSRMLDSKERLDRSGITGTRKPKEEGMSAVEAGKQADLMLEQAKEMAARADAVVLCIGEHHLQTGEAASRADITVPEVQMELFREICKINHNVAVVLFNGRPLDLREISEKARAVLEVWLPGTEGGHAVVDVLTGAYNPAGKLPMSFPYCVGQAPVCYNHYATGRPCQGKDDPVFFRSRYIDIPNEPLYSFGYGLSYTSFSISPVWLGSETMKQDGGSQNAAVTVKNTGNTGGTETLQLYIRDVSASVVRPVKELKGFKKMFLEAGEERTVIFEITEEMLRFYTITGTFASEKGRFQVWIGNSSDTENMAEFVLI